MESITVSEALKQIDRPEFNQETLRQRVIITLKRRLKGSKLFVNSGFKDEAGRQIIGVDAVRVYNPGRDRSYPISEMALWDAVLILTDIDKY